jgi:hypothetical protein
MEKRVDFLSVAANMKSVSDRSYRISTVQVIRKSFLQRRGDATTQFF